MPILKAIGPEKCQDCGRQGMTVYTKDGVPFGCTGCLSEFFGNLDPIKRPWRMSMWDDMKSLFRRKN